MDLDDLRARRARVIDVQAGLEPFEYAIPGDVEVRAAPSTAVPGTEYSVTPGGDGTWVAQQWYSEVGGTHPVAWATAMTLGRGLDWVWWMGASDYLAAYVRPAAEQKDLRRRPIAGEVAKSWPPGRLRDTAEAEARVPWGDASTDAHALGAAAATARGVDAMRLARNPRTPDWALAELMTRGGDSARWQVAGNPTTGRATLDLLRSTDDFGVRWHLSRRPETTTAELVAWMREDPALWSTVLDRQDLTPQQLEEVDAASSGALHQQVAEYRPAGTGTGTPSPTTITPWARFRTAGRRGRRDR